MSEQLARNSVKTYQFAPVGFETVRMRLRLIQNITFVGILGIFIAMDFKSADGDWLQGSLLSLLPHVFALTFVAALFFYSFHRAMKKQRENWLSYELMVGEDFVIRRMPGPSEMEIRREEVTAIRRNAQGLIIKTKSKEPTLAVPCTLEEFDEARARLSEWITPTELQRTGWRNSPYLVHSLVVLEFVPFRNLLPVDAKLAVDLQRGSIVRWTCVVFGVATKECPTGSENETEHVDCTSSADSHRLPADRSDRELALISIPYSTSTMKIAARAA